MTGRLNSGTLYEAELTGSPVELLGFKWSLLDYGDTTPQFVEDPINDRFGNVAGERNHCLSIHLAAGGVHSTQYRPGRQAVMKAARAVRLEQYQQAEECQVD